MAILITGSSGFIGGNFIRHWHKQYPSDTIVAQDRYPTSLASTLFTGGQMLQIQHDLTGTLPDLVRLLADYNCDTIVHFAAERSVDRSWEENGGKIFLANNFLGTANLLEAAGQAQVRRVHVVNTDEVFGSLSLGSKDRFDELSPYNPHSPYSFSKAAQGRLTRGYAERNGPLVTMSYHSNNYGPFQQPDSLISHSIARLLNSQPVPLYEGFEDNVREYTHVFDTCRALEILLNNRNILPGDEFCVGAGESYSNRQVAEQLLIIVSEATERVLLPERDIVTAPPGRPKDDERYGMDSSKMRDLGWTPEYTFPRGLEETVAWYRSHEGRLFLHGEGPAAGLERR